MISSPPLPGGGGQLQGRNKERGAPPKESGHVGYGPVEFIFDRVPDLIDHRERVARRMGGKKEFGSV